MPLGCRGHSGKVKCLAWGLDDNCISSAGAEGAVYEWGLRDFKRCRENVIKVLPSFNLLYKYSLPDEILYESVYLCLAHVKEIHRTCRPYPNWLLT